MSRLEDLTKNLVDVYAKRLNDQQRMDLIESLDILAKDAKYNVFKNTFPTDGPHSMSCYSKHKAFFDAGATYNKRAMIAGNRCISPWTFISTPTGERPAHEVFASEDADALSWDGEKECIGQVSGGFLKCIEPAYRLVMEDGSFFDCTKEHRVLAEDGWQSLSLLMSRSSGLRYWQRLEDYQANCVEDGYLCDQPLLRAEESVQALLPKGAYARKQLLTFSREDVKGRILRCNHVYRSGDLLSSHGEENRFSALFGQFQGAFVPQNVLPLKENTLSLVLSRLESFQKQELQKALQEETNRLDLCAVLVEFFDDIGMPQVLSSLIAYDWKFPSATPLVESGQELLRDNDYMAIFSPFEHPPLVGGKKIIAVVPIGFQPIIDATVKDVKSYKAGGVYHHNTGKSVAGAYETTCHATGLYPEGWEGKRYHKPLMIWVGADTSQTARDIIQYKLLGDIGDPGSGMIPKELIVETKTRRNIPDAIETIRVRHVSGGVSTIVIKTYEQGQSAWMGTEVDFIWIDEECPEKVYGEALIRLMTTRGSIILTFTPLQGLTPLVISFLGKDQFSDDPYPKYVAKVSWYDVPHLTPADIEKELARTPENMRAARSQGDPTVGAGRIYPLPLEQITVDDFRLQKYFPKAYGMDVGWNATASVFGAWDRDNDIIYIYSEYKQGKSDPVIHAAGIRSRGTWMRGTVDPASRASGQTDGNKLFEMYTRSIERGGGGLKLQIAANAIDAGIFQVWDRLQTGRLKIFKSCQQLLREYGMYHRTEEGKINKTNDHLLDSLRYLCMADQSIWKTPESDVASRRSNVIEIESRMRACM